MIQIENLETIVPAKVLAQLAQPEVDAILSGIAAGARDKWVQLGQADNGVGSHLKYDYVDAIQEVEKKPGLAVVALVGETAHLLENGAGQTDLRSTLLGPNVPVAPRGSRGKHLAKKGGYYRSIPFRHMTPGTKSNPRTKASGLAMGAAYAASLGQAEAKQLGKAVYKAAKSLQATLTNPYNQKTSWGERLPEGVGGAYPLTNSVGYTHKTDIYAGMVRQEKTYKSATQSSYTTFRTISENVTDGSWIRRPIPARHYAKQVSEYVEKIAAKAFEAYLKGRGTS